MARGWVAESLLAVNPLRVPKVPID